MTTPEGPDTSTGGSLPAAVEAAAGNQAVVRIEIDGRVIWQAIGAILLTLGLLWAIGEARGVVSMIAISFFFSLALEPGVRRLTERFDWRRGAAVGVIYVTGVLFAVVMIAVLIPALVELARVIGQSAGQWISNVNGWAEDYLGYELTDADGAASFAEKTDVALGEWADEVFGAVLGIATSGAALIFNLATIAMFTFYLTADAPRIKRSVLRLFTPATQLRVGWTWDQAIVQTG